MIKHRLGFTFALPIIVVGVGLTLIGIAAAIQGPVLGAIFILIGPFFWSSSYGSQIDTSKNIFREYGCMYGIKSGEWKALETMPYLTVLPGKSSMTVYSRTNISSTIVDEHYEVCLLDRSHRKRTTLVKFDTEQEAMDYSTQLSEQLNKEVVIYSPTVSENTRKRRKG